ncbi:SDR family oxidoreductase [Sphingomonas sp. NSE70-1]|uniref:SDR family oxidoreductase n=1 Tax=Sphingomonas caseinilyticus TaxID=2908205 RepID=A0ABT0RQI9_9SPHN|nr:SDR family oxidoreductase [Sphingomonas caseinilyticus]MCL6697280.1 SDR family oxidoreductase [Sphingomonas caseinilyticus]
MSKPLSNQTALVTGASRGIGRAIARRLADDGAHVFVHYNRSSGEADQLVTEIKQAGGSAEAIGANLEKVESVDQLIADAKSKLVGRKLDILVNNAGILESHSLGEPDVAALDRLLAVNVRAPYQLTSGLAGSLSDDARIIFTSSIVAKTVVGGAVYALTKGAIDTLTRYLAVNLGERGIRVNAIAPGAIETDMAAGFIGTDEGKSQVTSMQALKRIGQAEDIARVAGFLAGPDSGWVTGQVIDASGGSKL